MDDDSDGGSMGLMPTHTSVVVGTRMQGDKGSRRIAMPHLLQLVHLAQQAICDLFLLYFHLFLLQGIGRGG
jgi:hypothetical protein